MFDPWVRNMPWRRKWQLTPVFLPGKSHGQRSLAGCSPWGRKKSDTTERLTFSLSPRSGLRHAAVLSWFLCWKLKSSWDGEGSDGPTTAVAWQGKPLKASTFPSPLRRQPLPGPCVEGRRKQRANQMKIREAKRASRIYPR